MRWPWQNREPQRTSWVWCPNCDHDLNGDDNSFVEDDPDNGVLYLCASCGENSLWDFDIAPAAVLVRSWGGRRG